MKKFIKKLDAAYMTAWDWATSSKGAAYLLTIMIWGAVLIDPPKTLKDWLMIIVTVYYQGVALSAIGSNTKSEARETRELLTDTHNAELQEVADLKEMLRLAKEERQELTELVKYLHEKLDNGGN